MRVKQDTIVYPCEQVVPQVASLLLVISRLVLDAVERICELIAERYRDCDDLLRLALRCGVRLQQGLADRKHILERWCHEARAASAATSVRG